MTTKAIKKHNGNGGNVVALNADFGTLYVKVKGDQILRPIKAQMALFERLGHIYQIKGKYSISASGYAHLNKVASVSLVTPQTVIVDGVEKPNPYIERNPKTKAIETVNIRKIGIGYSPAGNLVIIDKTLFYNVYTYFIQSIQAKMKREEYKNGKKTGQKAYPNCAVYGTADEKPDLEGKWAFFETASPLGIWVNYEDQAIIDCLEEHTQRQRFGDRIAQTIVERNILKDHPAIGVSQVNVVGEDEKNPRAYVTVYGYRNDLEPPQIKEILRQAEKGSDEIEVKSEVIDMVDHEEEEAILKEAAQEDKEIADREPSLFHEEV